MIITRPSIPADEPFIYATWLRSQYFGNAWIKCIEQDAYYKHYSQLVKARLVTGTVTIACLQNDPDVVVGYSVVSKNGEALHWVYVKRAWRSLGVAKTLLPPTIKTVTSITRVGKAYAKSDWKFNPFWKEEK